VHLGGFIVGIRHDARSPERQILPDSSTCRLLQLVDLPLFAVHVKPALIKICATTHRCVTSSCEVCREKFDHPQQDSLAEY